MNVRLTATDALRSEAKRLVDRLSARGVVVSLARAGEDADLRLTSAEGLDAWPQGPWAVLGLPEPRDALVTGPEGAASLADLPDEARVGLAGPLRAEMLGVHRPMLRHRAVEDAREAADLLDRGEIDGWIAPLGSARGVGLGDAVREVFEPTSWATGVGRGSAVLRTEVDDDTMAEILAELDEPSARAALAAERAVLEDLGVGTVAPVGVMARPHGPLLRVRALIPARSGRRLVRAEFSGRLDDPETAGRRIAEELIARGGLELLATTAST